MKRILPICYGFMCIVVGNAASELWNADQRALAVILLVMVFGTCIVGVAALDD